MTETIDQARIEEILLAMQLGQEVSLADKLAALRAREQQLSLDFQKGNTDAFHSLESIRAQIAEVNKSIPSGRAGTGVVGTRPSPVDTHK